MATNQPALVATGTVNDGATTIYADIGTRGVQGGYPGSVSVLLLTDYTINRSSSAAYPSVPGLTGSATAEHDGLVLSQDLIIGFNKPEAVALINAGAATLVSYN